MSSLHVINTESCLELMGGHPIPEDPAQRLAYGRVFAQRLEAALDRKQLGMVWMLGMAPRPFFDLLQLVSEANHPARREETACFGRARAIGCGYRFVLFDMRTT